MVRIEKNGKETSAKRIQTVIDYAKKEKIKIVFYQEEFDGHQAEIIATEIKGATIKVTPLSPDYIDNLKSISDTFKKVME
jgi:zinc transport system substrate-binding protein